MNERLPVKGNCTALTVVPFLVAETLSWLLIAS